MHNLLPTDDNGHPGKQVKHCKTTRHTQISHSVPLALKLRKTEVNRHSRMLLCERACVCVCVSEYVILLPPLTV